ncbi:hypothetical protein ACQKNX_12180 [Lysinibacillus sp. NPDC093712]|uniref:hypothetical protein n=1 Tax=Lysinibacillus sp. NPDC093712 TaxID=3390579 RepID=UPI003D05FA4F
MFGNPASSNVLVATALLYGTTLNIQTLSTGSATITVEYTDSKGITGTYIINMVIN